MYPHVSSAQIARWIIKILQIDVILKGKKDEKKFNEKSLLQYI